MKNLKSSVRLLLKVRLLLVLTITVSAFGLLNVHALMKEPAGLRVAVSRVAIGLVKRPNQITGVPVLTLGNYPTTLTTLSADTTVTPEVL